MTIRSLINRQAELDNAVSAESAGAYFGKSTLQEHVPFAVQHYDAGTDIVFNYHFLKVLRRWLSGEVEEGEEYMSPKELTLLHNYETYTMDTSAFTGDVLIVVEALDKWLVDEVMHVDQVVVERDYSEDHNWRHTEERGAKLWQQLY